MKGYVLLIYARRSMYWLKKEKLLLTFNLLVVLVIKGLHCVFVALISSVVLNAK
jgi:hypothetical protein